MFWEVFMIMKNKRGNFPQDSHATDHVQLPTGLILTLNQCREGSSQGVSSCLQTEGTATPSQCISKATTNLIATQPTNVSVTQTSTSTKSFVPNFEPICTKSLICDSILITCREHYCYYNCYY